MQNAFQSQRMAKSKTLDSISFESESTYGMCCVWSEDSTSSKWLQIHVYFFAEAAEATVGDAQVNPVHVEKGIE